MNGRYTTFMDDNAQHHLVGPDGDTIMVCLDNQTDALALELLVGRANARLARIDPRSTEVEGGEP